ncbi:Hypothetical predicted protein [Olea europaea subsp. europaea]|uniref:Uncharacterized protein n=1 Tax=Olea europaea subsp. europaea TaxID=158383 RepID=A0A8S0QW76_OLEEU|nr:Hypothetical predicted protein [Olea europaea subsp. europaea]
MMEFEFCIPKEVRLRAHISQHSNLKLVKTLMDYFDERQPEDFRNSSLGYLAEDPNIQFSTQLNQQLVFRTVRTDKLYELWFSVQGHLKKFGLQEYVLVTELRCGSFPEGAEYERVLQRRTLKERRTTAMTSSLVGTETATISYPHVYVTLRPTDVEAQQPCFFTLVSYDDPLVLVLDDIARTVVAPQFSASGDDSCDGGHAGREDSDEETSKGGSSEEQRSEGDKEKGASGSNPDDEDSEDTGEFEGDRSSVSKDTHGGDRGASSSPRPSQDVYGGPAEPCPNEQDIPVDTENMQDAAHFAPCHDDVNLPVAAATEEVQDAGAAEPSNAVEDNDDDAEGCDVTECEGIVTEFAAPRPVLEPRIGVSTTRRRSTRLRRPTVATRTPYTGGRAKRMRN